MYGERRMNRIVAMLLSRHKNESQVALVPPTLNQCARYIFLCGEKLNEATCKLEKGEGR